MKYQSSRISILLLVGLAMIIVAPDSDARPGVKVPRLNCPAGTRRKRQDRPDPGTSLMILRQWCAKRGQRHGPFLYVWENGKKHSEGRFESGQRQGLWTSYHPNGRRRQQIEYKNGIPNGEQSSWRLDGSKKWRGTVANGQREGLWSWWNAAGQMVRQGTFKLGRLTDELHYRYYPDGGRMSVEHRKNGKKHGLYTEWYISRQLKQRGTYQLDRKSGEWIEWYDNGKVRRRGHYLNGVRSGNWTLFYDNGNKQEQGPYLNGQKHGTWQTFHPNGRRASRGRFLNSQRTGQWSYWDQTGRLVTQPTPVYPRPVVVRPRPRRLANEGPYRHKGLFLRMIMGIGYTTTKATINGTSTSIKGGAALPALSIGWSLIENLQISLDLFSSLFLSPRQSPSNSTLRNVFIYGVGAGMSWYLTPSNLYVGGGAGISLMTLSFKADETGTTKKASHSGVGLQLQFYVGKEWWVTEEWGIGVVGHYVFTMHPDKGSDARWFGHTFGISFSATYN